MTPAPKPDAPEPEPAPAPGSTGARPCAGTTFQPSTRLACPISRKRDQEVGD
jgi:hypothetical protein